MRVPHYATRSLAALALTVVVAGCGGDSTAPDAPFDPAGTSSDIGAVHSSFDSPAMDGYLAASAAISATLGASPAAAAVRVAPTKELIVGGKAGAAHYGATVAKVYRPKGGIQPSFSTAAAIPAEYLGVTFSYNVDTDQYQASDLDGAPADGVRFLVYATNPISGVIIEPLVEVGYADIVTTETATAFTVRIEVVSGSVTYLDYSVGVTGGETSGTVAVSGFISNGTDRVNFDLDTHVDLSENTLTADYNLTVPTRNGFRLDFEGEINLESQTTTATLEARGEHGTVRINGSQTGSTGTFEVRVNGELFATINYTQGGSATVTGADGQPLSQDELDALEDVFEVFIQGFDFTEDLLDPIA